jgi:hypothetical protein
VGKDIIDECQPSTLVCEGRSDCPAATPVGSAPASSRSMFAHAFAERRDLEQYFWDRDTVQRLIAALQFTSELCCLATPSLAHGLHTVGRDMALLDIDTRFAYLPRFRYWDILCPRPVDGMPFRCVVFDPPFFYIPMDKLVKAVLEVVGGDTDAKIMIGFLRREEPLLLKFFACFKLKRTGFLLGYAAVKENKWRNYALYANVDLPGIRRLKR